MRRPTFIVAEPEPDQAISSRKLLLETFKFNVITAHSEPEMLELLTVFPNVDAVILHDDTPGSTLQELVRTVKESCPGMRVVALNPGGARKSHLTDHVVNSHNPEELLHLLQTLFGDPRKINGVGKQLPGDPK